jgi:hypothetical protein
MRINVTRADHLPFEPSQIYDKIIAGIGSADLIIADLSGDNANVFYELGYAHALGKVVLPISSTAVPFDVRGFYTIAYRAADLPGLEKQLRRRIRQALKLIQRQHRVGARTAVDDHPAEAKVILEYALRKANSARWRGDEMYFTEREMVEQRGLAEEVVTGVLLALRDLGQIVCVNSKGNPVWRATDELRRTSIPLEGVRNLAQKAAYTFLARDGHVTANGFFTEESKRRARAVASERVMVHYPAVSEQQDRELAGILDAALMAAVNDLYGSARILSIRKRSAAPAERGDLANVRAPAR